MLTISLNAVWSALKFVYSVIKFFVNKLIQKFLFPVYYRSHGVWVHRNRIGAHWKPLGTHLEYSIYIGKLTDPEPRHTYIAIRAKERSIITRASFVFEAASAFQRYQEPIILHDLDRIPIKWTMRNIPNDRVFHSPDQGIIFQLNSYRFTNIELTMPNGIVIKECNSLKSTLTHTWFLNSEWIRVDGRYLNLDAIKFCRDDIAIYWRFGFCRAKYYYPGLCRSRLTIIVICNFLSRPLSAVMSSDLAVKFQFWLAALTFWHFSEEGKLVPRFSKGLRVRGVDL